MALFGSKKKKEETKVEEAGVSLVASRADFAHILRHARITEKASMNIEQSVHVFDVAEDATKRDVLAAVKKLYSVTPRKIRVTIIPSKTKRNMRTGRTGVKKGGKKAYVYLKSGDTINL